MSSFLALFGAIILDFATIKEPVVNMRENPSHASKVVSQAIFAEDILILSQEGDWSHIQTSDRYAGWIPSETIIFLNNPSDFTHSVSRSSAHIYHLKDTEYGPVLSLPFGTKIKVLDSSDSRWAEIQLPENKIGFIQKGDIEQQPPLNHRSELVSFSQRFLGLPYTWGGRSSFGFDCSGFVQFLYNQIGIHLPRDSKDQIKDPLFQTIEIDQLQPGDLIFWGKGPTKILHVGMYIGEGRFIHATSRENQPWIRISHVEDAEWNGNSSAYYPYREAKTAKLGLE